MSKASPGTYDGSPEGVVLDVFPTAQKLADRALEFLTEVQHLYVPRPVRIADWKAMVS